MFFVVVIHVASYGMEVLDPMTFNWIIRNIITCAVRCAVPIFFMLSGILFLEKEVSVKILYKKYIARIAIAWAVWSAFYAVIDYIASLKSGEASLYYFVLRFLTGHYHLWFLPALIVAYIFQPVLQELIAVCSTSQIKYIGWITFIGVIGKETLEPFFSGQAWDSFWGNFSIPMSSTGIIYFVLGYYLYKNKNWLSQKKI